MVNFLVNTAFGQRIFNALIPVLSWLIITMPAWLSPFHPAVVAYFIIAFDLYFLYKAISTTYFATLSYRLIQMQLKISYNNKLAKIKNTDNLVHFIIIPNYKEPLYKLEQTINALVNNDYPYKRIYLVLAFEKRESEAYQKASFLQK